MGLTYCEECGCIEGKTTVVEIVELDYAYGIEVCSECGSEDTIKYVPEHDDNDMER